ncbi:MAG: radical SAM family heme chaperone HemW [Magnetococcales bacterium]|nr:radical SAM family heme chaperone HemW [Magnetococcales bacterium]
MKPDRARTVSIYIHVPFCVQKCHYCAFNSTASREMTWQEWLQVLLKDIEFHAHHRDGRNRKIVSIFFGGGTPSLLPTEILERIIVHIHRFWPLVEPLEITLEANPESTNFEKLTQWRSLGINRLSLGVQAMDDARLSLLGRPHTSQMARDAFHAAMEAGFTNINLDLITGSPGHTSAQWHEELMQVLALKPQHLSCYDLSVEPGTPLAHNLEHNHLQLPDEDTRAALYSLTQNLLGAHGFERYEISNYARPGFYCRHNQALWLSGDYVGLGPAAHGKITLGTGTIMRWVNHWPLNDYVQALQQDHPPMQWLEISSREEAAADCLLMGLRLVSGIPRDLYRDIAGQDLVESKAREVDFLEREGLLHIDCDTIRFTARGLDFMDSCLLRLI